jgi:hypothetical protein
MRSGIVLLSIAAGICIRAADMSSCAASPAARQLDYWVGDWSVSSPDAPGTGHSKVYLSLDQCLLVESWKSDTSPHNGENAIAYNAADNTWYGLFVDNHGRVHSFKGAATAGSAAALQGPALDENGKPILKRVRIVRAAADKVEQIWEKSLDNGATWVTEFRMEYARTRP